MEGQWKGLCRRGHIVGTSLVAVGMSLTSIGTSLLGDLVVSQEASPSGMHATGS
jgi:hypothetical protein